MDIYTSTTIGLKATQQAIEFLFEIDKLFENKDIIEFFLEKVAFSDF